MKSDLARELKRSLESSSETVEPGPPALRRRTMQSAPGLAAGLHTSTSAAVVSAGSTSVVSTASAGRLEPRQLSVVQAAAVTPPAFNSPAVTIPSDPTSPAHEKLLNSTAQQVAELVADAAEQEDTAIASAATSGVVDFEKAAPAAATGNDGTRAATADRPSATTLSGAKEAFCTYYNTITDFGVRGHKIISIEEIENLEADDRRGAVVVEAGNQLTLTYYSTVDKNLYRMHGFWLDTIKTDNGSWCWRVDPDSIAALLKKSCKADGFWGTEDEFVGSDDDGNYRP